MSIDAFIFTRTEPMFGMQDRDVLTIEYVQILKPRPVSPEDWRRLRRAPDPTLRWLTDVNCSNSAYMKLEMFALGLARRCGGGVWWCDMTDDVIEVPPRPDPGTWSLRRALEVAQNMERDLDERETDDEVGDAAGDGNPRFSFSAGPAGQFMVHGQVAAKRTEPEWEIGFAKRGNADVWQGTAGSVRVLALLEGHGANQVGKYCLGTMRRALDHTRGHRETNPIQAGYAAQSPAAWIQWAHDHAMDTTFKKPLFKRRPQGWGTLSIMRMEGDQLRIAHVGDSRAFLLGPRGVMRLATEQVHSASLHGPHLQPASAIGTDVLRPEEQTVTLEPGDSVVMLSYEMWTDLEAKRTLETVVLEGLIEGAQAGAELIMQYVTATCGAVVVALYGGSSGKYSLPEQECDGAAAMDDRGCIASLDQRKELGLAEAAPHWRRAAHEHIAGHARDRAVVDPDIRHTAHRVDEHRVQWLGVASDIITRQAFDLAQRPHPIDARISGVGDGDGVIVPRDARHRAERT